jgi:hypothetical protein
MDFILNPENFEAEYLHFLNECFSGWGDGITYKWVYRRNMELASSDIFLIEEDRNIIAGSALTYRYIQFPGGKKCVIGTMTGSWTLPQARGKGCFTEIIRYSGNLIAEHDYDFLTAYVTEQNASYRRLKSEGSYLINTYYVRSGVNAHTVTTLHFEEIETTEATLLYLYNLRKESSAGSIHYAYDFESFVTQFVNRPNTKIILLKQNENYFILEETEQTFRILYATSYNHGLIAALMSWAGAKNKNIFFLTTLLDTAYEHDENFTVIPGFLTLLANKNKKEIDCETRFGQLFFSIQYGDKM